MPTKPMPRLSETLSELPTHEFCQHCMKIDNLPDAWREHDDDDKQEDRYIWLCEECASSIIDPHPRLYSRVPFNAPIPGVMRVCDDCAHRDGNRCANPNSLRNGGEGIRIFGSKPQVFFIDGRDKSGRRFGSQHTEYHTAPTCEGMETVEQTD